MSITIFKNCIGFDWDDNNQNKNLVKHGVNNWECEQFFLNEPIVYEDIIHSSLEKRFKALGITDSNKCLFIAFTVREGLIRVISARSMNKKERKEYEKAKERDKANS
jgi:uncharacterized DUF497 family protein